MKATKSKPRIADPSRLMATALVAWSWTFTYAQANPTGGSVAAGAATISSPSASKLVISATTAKTIINWASFNIGSGESVLANLPGASSILLNRVGAGGGPSLLLGSLTSNGRVYLVNPAGIVVGAGSQITAAQLLLSTHGLSDANFLGGHYIFDQPGDAGAGVVNHGSITATGGAAILAGERVKNDGVIAAEFGTVVLAGAKTYTVDFAGDGLLKFAVTTPVDALPAGARSLVENSGTISARGGTVLLTAAAAKGVIANVINTSGIIEATSVAAVNGKIVLSGSGGGTEVAGALDASGRGAGETGGQVAVLGDSVTLAPGARIDVSGDSGGGTALIGGNFRGKGPQRNAQATTVAAGAAIHADAITRGDGGRVAVWSDGDTSFGGSITARGGAQGGNGGFVETSGERLFVTGTVDTRAPLGRAGTWLLDPSDFTICPTTVCTTSGAAIAGALANGEVIIEAFANPGNNTEIANGTTTNSGPSTGNITVSDIINYASGQQLSLLAEGNISVTPGGSIQNFGSGNVNLVAGSNGSAGLNAGGTSFNAATLLGIANSYGQNGGSVAIGNGAQAGGIAVGSAGGTTTIAANNLTLTGGSGTNGSFAQVGFAGNATGDINVRLTGNLALDAGTGDGGGTFAQIGHGAADLNTSGPVSGNIDIQVAGTTTFNPTATTFGSALIGNASTPTTMGGSTGNVSLVSGFIATPTNHGLGSSIGNDIPGGNVLIEATAPGATLSVGDNTTHQYSSTFGITLEAPAGTVAFNGILLNDSSGSVTVTAASISAQGSITTAGGAVTTNGPVVLTGDMSIDTTHSGQSPGANITVNGTVNDASGSPGSAMLTVAAGAAGAATFNGAVGGPVGGAPIAALNVSAGAIDLNGSVTTFGALVNFSGPVALQSDVTIDTTAGGANPGGAAISFFDVLGDSTFEGQRLTLLAGTGGNIDFAGDVGFAPGTRLKSLTITGAGFVTSEGGNGISAGSFVETLGTGDLVVAGEITTGIGPAAVNPGIVNGGPISITTAGNVTVGANLAVPGANGTYLASLYSGGADAGSVGNGFGIGVGAATGNAGAITVTAGGTITLYNGASARGGRTDRAGVSGGNAAPIALTSTGGDVIIGFGPAANPDCNLCVGVADRGVFLNAFGGDSLAAAGAGNGGNGAAITVSGRNITAEKIVTAGGDTTNALATGGAGAGLSLTAVGGTITLYGLANAANDAEIVSRGGDAGATAPGQFGELTSTATGTIDNAAGNITLTAANIQLATGTAGANPGSTVSVSAVGGGAAGIGGSSGLITFAANVDATTSNVESLYLRTKGGVVVTGDVGDNAPPNTITLVTARNFFVGGSAIFHGAVTVGTAFTDMRTAGSLEIDGFFSVLGPATFTPPSGTSTVSLLGGAEIDQGAAFTNTGGVTLGGTFSTAGGALSFAGPVVLASDTTVDTTNGGATPNGASITFSSTIDDSVGNPGGAGLTAVAGTSGALTFGGAIGGVTPIGFLTVSSAQGVSLGGNITTAGGSVFFTSAPTVLSASVTIDTTSGNPGGGDVSFDSLSPIDSTNATQSLTVIAGVSSVEFDAALGGNQALKSLTATDGQFTANGEIKTAGGAVVITTAQGNSGNTGQAIFSTVDTGGGAFTATASGTAPVITLNGNILTGAGNVTVTATGTGSAQINVGSNSMIATTSGSVLMSAIAGTAFGDISNDGMISTGTGAVTLTASSTGSSANIYLYNRFFPVRTIATAGGPVTISATGAAFGHIALQDVITTGAGDVSVTAQGGTNSGQIDMGSSGSITTTTGGVTLNASSTSANTNIYLYKIHTGSGNVTATATAATQALTEVVSLGLIQTNSGNVTLNAEGGNSLGEIEFSNSSVSTASGNVTLMAQGDSAKIYLGDPANAFLPGQISTGSGNVTMTADATGTSDADISITTSSGVATTSGTVVLNAISAASDATVDVFGSITTQGSSVVLSAFAPIDTFVDVDGSVSIGPGGSLTLIAHSTDAANGDGEAYIDGTVTTNGGAVTLIGFGTDYSEIDTNIVTTNGGPVTLLATADDAEIYPTGTITTNGGAVTIAARGVSYAEIDSGNFSTGAGTLEIGVFASAGAAEFFPFGAITTTSGDVVLVGIGANSDALNPTVFDAHGSRITTTSGNVFVGVESGVGASTMTLDGIIASGGTLTAIAAGTNSLMTVGGCFCGNPVSTNGGAMALYVNGQGGILHIAELLMLNGPTTLVAQAQISGGPIDPPPGVTLDVFGPLTAAVNIPVTQHAYSDFPGIPFPAFGGAPSPPPTINPPPPAPPAVVQYVPPPLPPPQQLPVPVTYTVIAPPPPVTTLTLDTGPTNTTSPTLTTVTDLDSGGQLFTQIAPTSGDNSKENQDPTTVVTPVTKAQQPQPKTQVTETPLGGAGSNIFQTHQTFVQHLGVPGIGQPASMGGNRSLWFASVGGQ